MPENTKQPEASTNGLKRWRLLLPALLIVVLLTALGAIGIQHLQATSHQPVQATATRSGPTAMPTPDTHTIAEENQLPGTSDWLIPDAQAATTQIQAYAGATSVSPGQTLTFYVSTQAAGTTYTIQVYRLGWYDGAGGRLMATQHAVGQAQGYYDWANLKLVGCTSCLIDPATKLIEARWQPSFSITIPANWITGLYEAKLTDANNMQTVVSFEVRGNLSSTYVAVIADNTTAAYNDWGGYSLYHGPDGSLSTRATKVSFDRPALGWRFGYGNGLSYEIDAIRWLERQGYDVSYISSVDLHEHPEQLLNHRAYLSLGHDEYWSKEMRDGVEQARDAGIGLAFFGANVSFWQIRYAPDSQGTPDRTIICYKDAHLDPLLGVDNSRVTVEWRDPPVFRPENALVGIMYIDWTTPPKAFPWQVSANAPSDLLTGTGLQPGQQVGCNLVGYEWDGIFDNGATPQDLWVLGASHVISDGKQTEVSNTTYYIATSGAMVFASGSIYWSYALDDLRVWDFPHPAPRVNADPCLLHSAAVPQIQTLMALVMSQVIVRHVNQ